MTHQIRRRAVRHVITPRQRFNPVAVRCWLISSKARRSGVKAFAAFVPDFAG